MNLYVVSEQIGLQGYWITDILAGITKEAMKKNITVLDYNGQKLEMTDEFTRPIVLAVGYTVHWLESCCKKLRQCGIEPLLVNAAQDPYLQMLSSDGFVSFDIKKSMYRCFRYLVDHQRDKIAFFSAQDETHSEDIKIHEFLQLNRHLRLTSGDVDVYRESNLQKCAECFYYNVGLYTAVICSSDAAALFLIKWLEEHGVRVPQDLFVVGFGNSAVSARVTPSLTTIECNYFELGRQAVKLHQFLQRNTDVNCASIMVECKLLVRGSTNNCPAENYNFDSLRPVNVPHYGMDPDVMTLLQIEELLRMWDEIDKNIVQGLMHDKTITAIAESLFISVSAVKYRIKKMLTATSLKNKDELVEVLRHYRVV